MNIYISKNISYLMHVQRYKQNKLASLLGVTSSSIADYKNGRSEPLLKKVVLLAEIFKVTLDELVLTDLEAQSSTSNKTLIDKFNDPSEKFVVSEDKTSYGDLDKEMKRVYAEIDLLKKEINKLKEKR